MNYEHSWRCHPTGYLAESYFSAGCYFVSYYSDGHLSASDPLTTICHEQLIASFLPRMTAPDVVYPNIQPSARTDVSGCSSSSLHQSRYEIHLAFEVCHTLHMKVLMPHNRQDMS